MRRRSIGCEWIWVYPLRCAACYRCLWFQSLSLLLQTTIGRWMRCYRCSKMGCKKVCAMSSTWCRGGCRYITASTGGWQSSCRNVTSTSSSMQRGNKRGPASAGNDRGQRCGRRTRGARNHACRFVRMNLHLACC